MKNYNEFVGDFYCDWCGSMTAVKVANKDAIRCMGCLKTFRAGSRWKEVNIEQTTQRPPPPDPSKAIGF